MLTQLNGQRRLALMLIVLATYMSLHSAKSTSADIVRNISTADRRLNPENDGYFALGLGLTARRGTWQRIDESTSRTDYAGSELIIAWDYRYQRVFFEGEWGSLDGINIGIQVSNNSLWSVDILYSLAENEQSIDDDTSRSQTFNFRDQALLYSLNDRQYLSGAGIRFTSLIGSYIVQYRLLKQTGDPGGLYSSLRVGCSWAMRNGIFYALASLEYNSQKVNDHLYGVGAAEATQRFPEYRARSGSYGSVKVGTTYPLSEHWVADISLLLQSTSKAERNSPITNDNRYIPMADVSIKYVF